MKGLMLTFDDEEVEYDQDEDKVAWKGQLRAPRSFYADLLAASAAVRMDWLFREGIDLLCETCKSFIIPAKGLYRAIMMIKEIPGDGDSDEFWRYEVLHHLIKTYPMTAEAWKDFVDGKLRHVPFLRDSHGDLECEEDGPQYIAYDDVVFTFRRKCLCEGLYKRMYENIAGDKGNTAGFQA